MQGINLETGKKYTVNQQRYFDNIYHLRNAIKFKQLDLSKKVMLVHNNARSHTARLITALITNLKWHTFPYSAYSPDLAPFNFWANRV